MTAAMQQALEILTRGEIHQEPGMPRSSYTVNGKTGIWDKTLQEAVSKGWARYEKIAKALWKFRNQEPDYLYYWTLTHQGAQALLAFKLKRMQSQKA